MSEQLASNIGWVASALFVVSYFLNEKLLRAAQASSAFLWILYGIGLELSPVILTNVLVCAAAVFTMMRRNNEEKATS